VDLAISRRAKPESVPGRHGRHVARRLAPTGIPLTRRVTAAKVYGERSHLQRRLGRRFTVKELVYDRFRRADQVVRRGLPRNFGFILDVGVRRCHTPSLAIEGVGQWRVTEATGVTPSAQLPSWGALPAWSYASFATSTAGARRSDFCSTIYCAPHGQRRGASVNELAGGSWTRGEVAVGGRACGLRQAAEGLARPAPRAVGLSPRSQLGPTGKLTGIEPLHLAAASSPAAICDGCQRLINR